ncbi:hypothetical protein SmJEL517_g04649 [Synchytrium microbalum]|uniref:SET domain-containing protein n=1 Tax=Synchytrium microbalum TaxID=1806994 RepID=A0A507C2N0_9FUNG|nr:uncharacterized protein SmJEL517_g04649 [Synchytrium microbalum]TPX32206.1 hypothetical protein SmJEL517_g04649 [Synchytrium microbalum]
MMGKRATTKKEDCNTAPTIKKRKGMPADTQQVLFGWASKQGAKLELLQVEIRDGERGVYANSNINPGERIAYIPDSIVLSESMVEKTELGLAVATLLPEFGSTWSYWTKGLMLMIAYMVHELYVKQDGSFWYPYLSTLPETYDLPIVWEEDMVERELNGTNMAYFVSEKRKELRRAFDAVSSNESIVKKYFPTPGALTFDHWLWAYCSISSRAFPKRRSAAASEPDKIVDTNKKPEEYSMRADDPFILGDPRVEECELAMWPVLDMLNHARGHKIEWITSHDGISFVAQQSVAKGAEVMNNYGPKGNELLLGHYGFVISLNEEDYVKVKLAVDTDSTGDETSSNDNRPTPEDNSAPLSRLQQKLIHLKDLGLDDRQFLLFENDVEIPVKMLRMIRVLLTRTCDGDLTDGCNPVSPRCEIEVYHNLWKLLKGREARLLENPVTAEGGDDSDGVEEPDARKRFARIYRQGQRRILEHAIGLVRSQCKSYIESRAASGTSFIFLDPLEENEFMLDDETRVIEKIVYLKHENPLLKSLASSRTAAKVAEILGLETEEAAREHYNELVQDGVLKLDEEAFLWGATVLESHSAPLSLNFMVEVLGLSPNEELDEEQEDVSDEVEEEVDGDEIQDSTNFPTLKLFRIVQLSRNEQELLRLGSRAATGKSVSEMTRQAFEQSYDARPAWSRSILIVLLNLCCGGSTIIGGALVPTPKCLLFLGINESALTHPLRTCVAPVVISGISCIIAMIVLLPRYLALWTRAGLKSRRAVEIGWSVILLISILLLMFSSGAYTLAGVGLSSNSTHSTNINSTAIGAVFVPVGLTNNSYYTPYFGNVVICILAVLFASILAIIEFNTLTVVLFGQDGTGGHIKSIQPIEDDSPPSSTTTLPVLSQVDEERPLPSPGRRRGPVANNHNTLSISVPPGLVDHEQQQPLPVRGNGTALSSLNTVAIATSPRQVNNEQQITSPVRRKDTSNNHTTSPIVVSPQQGTNDHQMSWPIIRQATQSSNHNKSPILVPGQLGEDQPIPLVKRRGTGNSNTNNDGFNGPVIPLSSLANAEPSPSRRKRPPAPRSKPLPNLPDEIDLGDAVT